MNRRPKQTEETKKRIFKAFVEIAKEKGVYRVNVKEISERANINRSTFYEYFLDVYDLLHQYEKIILEKLEKDIQQMREDNMLKSTQGAIYMFNRFDEDFTLLLSNKGDPEFNEKIREMLSPVFKDIFFDEMNEVQNLDYLVNYAMSAVQGTLSYWEKKGYMMDENEIIKLLETLLKSGFDGYHSMEFYEIFRQK